MFKKIKSEVKKKLLLPIKYVIALVTIILFLLISGYIYYSHLSSSVDIKYQTSLKTIAHTQNDKINIWFNNWLGKLNSIAGDSSITHFISLQTDNPSYKVLRENIETQLRSYLADNDFSALEVLNSDNQVVYASGIKLGEKSSVIKCGINNTKNLGQIKSCSFLLSKNNEVRLAVSYNLQSINNQAGTIYAEILTDAAFGSSLNNILINHNSDVDIYYRDGMNLISLQSYFYNTLHFEDAVKPEVIINLSDLIGINASESLISFKDRRSKEQFAYFVNNDRTGWIVTARDKNKENYSYLIEQLSSYLLAGLIIVIIIAVLVLLLWKKTLMFYSSAVRSDYENINLKERFDHFVKFSNDIYFLLDKNGSIKEFNDKAFTKYGYTDEEFKLLNIRDLRTRKDRTLTDDYFKNAEKLNGLIFDTTHLKKDKTEFEVEVSMRLITIDNEKLIQCIVRDVSERINLEKRLKESELIFELISNNLNEVIYISSLKPHKEFEYISPTIETLTGYKPNEFYEDPNLILRILHPDDRYRIQQMVEGKLEENRLPSRLITKSEKIIWVLHRSIERKNSKNETIGFIGIIKDISEKVKLDLQLTQIKDSYKYIFENNPLPMWLFDYNLMKFLNVNQAAVKHYGYTKEEFLDLEGELIRNNILAESTIDDLCSKTSNGQFREETHKLKNGGIISVEVYSQKVEINSSGSLAVLEVLKDITKSKKAEEKIFESEQRFKTLTKISPVAIFRTNGRGELTYVNEYWIEMTGIYPEIAFGRKWWDGLPIQDKEIAEKNWKRSVSVSNSFESEYQLINPKSKVKWVLASIVKITTSQSKVIGYIGTLTDISKMKMFEGNFRKLYYSVEQSPVSIVITDKKGNIEYINPAVIKSTGYNKEELIGNNSRIINSGHQKKSFYSELWTTISSGRIWEGEFYNKRKDGSYYWEQASISPVLSERGEITNYVAVKEDITLKKKLHEELVDAKNMAIESGRIKTNFLKQINHELRTPLVGVIGIARAIYDDADSPRMKELGKCLLSDSKRLNKSLKSILSFSSFETQPKYFKIAEVDISDIIKRVSYNFLDEADYKNLRLILKDLSVKAYVKGNLEMITDIISYIVDNAIKFTKKGSVTVNNHFSDDEYIISVKDTGIGIPESKKEIIFEPFRKIDEEDKEVSGVGLGLTLAKKYIDALGGKLWFESKVDEGTTFYLSFKLAKQPLDHLQIINSISKQPALNSNNGKRKLLIIEDDEINLRIATMYLKDLFVITTATDSDEALEHTKHEKFDVILMDIGLKNGLSGTSLTELLRKMDDYKNIPIIAVTAFTMESDKEKIFSAGCSHYLAKPYTKEDLRNIVNGVLL
jgi:PAS domain S-box-containing protein